MPSLNVIDFSCLRHATLELAPVNIIIGPQGSGKSVTTKLFYFCSDILNNFVQSAERREPIESYRRSLSRQFAHWFPPSAWGSGRFNINYSAGDFTVRILRRKSQGKPADDVSITFSDWFNGFYEYALKQFASTAPDDDIETTPGLPFIDELDRVYRIRSLISRRLVTELGDDFLSSQTFIPAGRAFFTSIGRLVAGFEQAGSLDPVTLKFARLFANVRDRGNRGFPGRGIRSASEFGDRRNEFMTTLFGGEIKFEDDAEFVEAVDGRKIPFASLSSGQQELLPMWSIINYFSEFDEFRARTRNRERRPRELIYIEEPEAHLFPSAQSMLMEFLIGFVLSERQRRSLIITTHSPYIMSKLNLFLKAGQLSRRKRRNQGINEIVPRECWLAEGQLAAFAIQDGELRDLLDDDGLIDGRYLDDISEQISRDFSQLLKVEADM